MKLNFFLSPLWHRSLSLPCWLLGVVLCFTTSQAMAGKPAEAEWKLVQSHFERGDATVFVSHDAVKVVKDGYEILAKAPDWTVYCYRPTDKTMWTGRLDQFNGIILTSPWAVPKNKKVPLKVLGTLVKHGTKVTESSDGPQTRYFTSNEMPVAPQAAYFLCRYYFVPETDKVPLDFLVMIVGEKTKIERKEFPWMDMDLKTTRNGLRYHLATKSLAKIPYDASMFTIPTGYKRVSDVNQIAYSQTQQGQMTNLMEDLGTASKFTVPDTKPKK